MKILKPTKKILLFLLIMTCIEIFQKSFVFAEDGLNQVLPSYIDDEIDVLETRINELNQSEMFSFSYITDIHSNQGTYSPMANCLAFAKIGNSNLLHFGVCAGDTITSNQTDLKNGKALQDLMYYSNMLKNTQVPILFARGNHDCNARSAISSISGEQYYQSVLSHLQGKAVFDTNHLGGDYYYQDFEEDKIRVCVLNAFNGSNYEFVFGNDQLEFVANKVLNLSDKSNPAEWQVLFVTHTVDESVAHSERPSDCESLYKIINAFQEGKKATIENLTVDYTLQEKGAVIAIISGHHHLDDTMIKNNILIVLVRSATIIMDREDIDNERFNKDDISFDVFSVDKKNKMLYATKVGRGKDRQWSYDVNSLAEKQVSQKQYSVSSSATNDIKIGTMINHNKEVFAIATSDVPLQEKSNKTWILSQDKRTYIKRLNDVEVLYNTTFTNQNGYSKNYTFHVPTSQIVVPSFMFDATYYADMNPDLKKAFGYNEIVLKNHYLNSGIKEGRKATPIFDVSYYLNHNNDLKRAYGTNYEEAYKHFINQGIVEGRQGSRYFNSSYYLNNNKDLKKAFNENELSGILHFANSGISEGRKASEAFNVIDFYNSCSGYAKNKLGKNYIKYYAYSQGANVIQDDPIDISNYMFDSDLYYSLYPDLQKAIGNNPTALKNHYLTCGLKEGRIASYVFNPVYYLANNNDLKKAFGENGYVSAYYHFIQTGIYEGRVASATFNVRVYLEKYKDLANSFGNNYSKALEHFVMYGRKEGRRT